MPGALRGPFILGAFMRCHTFHFHPSCCLRVVFGERITKWTVRRCADRTGAQNSLSCSVHSHLLQRNTRFNRRVIRCNHLVLADLHVPRQRIEPRRHSLLRNKMNHWWKLDLTWPASKPEPIWNPFWWCSSESKDDQFVLLA